MRRPLRRLLAVAGATVAALAIAACGDSKTLNTHGDNTGNGGVPASYLTLGSLEYQVQVSRRLNPSDPEDKGYLTGLPPGTTLQPGQIWFGVFVLVRNVSHQPAPAVPVEAYTLTDTEGNTYRPLSLSAANPYAYRPQLVASGNQLPVLGSIASYGPTQAALVLYKVPGKAYTNLPLVEHIADTLGTGKSVSVILDA